MDSIYFIFPLDDNNDYIKQETLSNENNLNTKSQIINNKENEPFLETLDLSFSKPIDIPNKILLKLESNININITEKTNDINTNLYNMNCNSFFPSDNNNISPTINSNYLNFLNLKSKVSPSSYEKFNMNKYE